MTVMVESEEGTTHSPPMKNRFACRIGTETSLAEMDMGPLLTVAPGAVGASWTGALPQS
jgi:hypothetical protein